MVEKPEKETPKVFPGPNFYKLEELGPYVDAAPPVLDVSILIARPATEH
jgi:hypothetical protein